MTVRALFDVNMLLALFDDNYVHHRSAAVWWDEHRDEGWASCAITQNGFLRVISKPGYERPLKLASAMSLLREQIALPGHEFWPDRISLVDSEIVDHKYVLGPNQITDLYLLALAVTNHGRLVTFDRAIPLAAVRGAEQRHLVVL
jgi:toxin-antitoxin system PIN domain toxin